MNSLGLFWYAKSMPANYLLKLQWNRFKHEATSSVLVRFPDTTSKNYRNTAYVPSHYGYEVEIDELAQPDGQDKHRTGAIYGVDARTSTLRLARPAGRVERSEPGSGDESLHVSADPL
jgi:hypothetical protein